MIERIHRIFKLQVQKNAAGGASLKSRVEEPLELFYPRHENLKISNGQNVSIDLIK
jgi:hypothetical protein